MSVSTLNSAALAALERAIADALSLDPRAARAIGTLEGKVLHLQCRMPPFDIYLLPRAGGLHLQASCEAPVDCRVSGQASEFIEVLSANDRPAALVNGGLSIDGDTAALMKLQEVLSSLELDWEARLSILVGDIPAHQLGRFARGSARWGRSSLGVLRRHVDEFIHEEARLAPPRLEVEDFFDDLQQLDQRLQRLQARLRRQQKRVDQLGKR